MKYRHTNLLRSNCKLKNSILCNYLMTHLTINSNPLTQDALPQDKHYFESLRTLMCRLPAGLSPALVATLLCYSHPASYQDRAAGAGLQAGQAAGQQSSVAAVGVVLQRNAVRLRIFHDQTRVLGLRQAGVQVTSTGIHQVTGRRQETGEQPTAGSTAGRQGMQPVTVPWS